MKKPGRANRAPAAGIAPESVRQVSARGEPEVKPTPITSLPATARKAPSAEQIRARAHEIYLSRKGAPGDPVADWLQAERELMGGRPSSFEVKPQAAPELRLTTGG